MGTDAWAIKRRCVRLNSHNHYNLTPMRSGFGGYLAVQYKQTIIDDEKVGLRVKPLSA